MPRFVEILATGAVAAMLLAGAAHADSRLFGARSDTGGVSVTAASLDGRDLAVAGHGGGVTFFRLDNPGGPVPCSERIAFTGSNGLVATIDTDICAHGAEVTVPFSTAGVRPAPAAPPAPPAAAGTPSGTQPVTISVDDPSVTIDGIFMGGRPVAINRRFGNAVEILVAPGADGIACSRDLGLVLSDGRRIARAVDICANDWKVEVTLLAPGGTPGAPSAPPAPPTAGGPAPVAGDATWVFSSTRDNGSLSFTVPGSGESEFTAVCASGTNQVTLALGRSAPEVRPGAMVTVGLSAGSFAQAYRAIGSDRSPSGLSNPLIKLGTDDPLWPAIIHENAITVQIGSAAPYALSLSGSAAKARQFLAYCNPPPPVLERPPGPAARPIPSPDSGAIPFACDDGSFISVVFDDANRRVIVTEAPGGPPNVLRRVPSREGARYVGSGGDELVGLAETITWSRGGSYPATCRPR